MGVNHIREFPLRDFRRELTLLKGYCYIVTSLDIAIHNCVCVFCI